MPLGTRDFLLVLRARDEASRVVMGLGQTFGTLTSETERKLRGAGAVLTSLGVGMGVLGVAGVRAFGDMALAAAEYEFAAARTLTQVDQVGVGLEDLKRIGRDVANAIPAPFEQMQESLYDIFSSMDVNVNEAEDALAEFSRAAVAGTTDVGTAGKATIAILNGFKIPVSEVTRVMDVQFQSVRKGVITYEEFSKSIGRAIPSTVRAGQSVETLAGMMAFLTRNGLSASMAATSAARAMDAIAHPKTIGRLEQMGIVVRDASGEFLPLVQIMEQLSLKLSDLTAPARAAALQDLFKSSGGTIQARRFFDVAITGFDEFRQRIDEMSGPQVAGALDDAYDIMFNQPQMQIQLLKNRLATLRTEFGEFLVPVLRRVVEVGITVVEWFRDLPRGMQEAIVKGGALVSVLLVLSGIILTMTGMILLLASAWSKIKMVWDGVQIAILAVRVAMLSLTPAVFALGAAFALVTGGLLAFTLIKFADIFGKADKAAKKWAESLTDVYDKTQLLSATQAHHVLVGEHIKLTRAIKRTEQSQDALNKKYATGSSMTWKVIHSKAEYERKLKHVNKEMDKFRPQLESLQMNYAKINETVKISVADFDALSQKLGLDFTKGFEKSEAARERMIDHLVGIEEKAGLSWDALKEMGDGTVEWSEEAAEAISKFGESVGEAFTAANDIIADFGDKTDTTVRDIQKWYTDHVTASQNFASNVAFAIEKGYDPALIARVLEAGPKQAGPLLQQIVGNHSDTLVKMVNEGEAALRNLNVLTVQMGRLTQMALQATTDQMARDLPIAMRVVQTQFKNGGEMSVRELAAALGVGVGEVDRIVRSFGITVKHVSETDGAAKAQAGGNSIGAAMHAALAAWEGRMFSAGADWGEGIKQGFSSKMRALEAAAHAAGVRVTAHMRRLMQTDSPSKVMFRIGQDIGQGLVLGIRDRFTGLERATRDMADIMVVRHGSTDQIMNRITVPSPREKAQRGSIIIQEGAVKIDVRGDANDETIRRFRAEATEVMYELLREIRSRM